MARQRHVVGLLLASLLLSLPSLTRIPRMLPLRHAEVRVAAPAALSELRSKGVWLVNVDLTGIERTPVETCFTWEHRYRSRTTVATPEILTTCIDASEH